MQRQTKLDGIVIRRANIGEADRIVTFLTPQGKVAAVARGVRKMTSKKAGSLELFHVVHLVLSQTGHLPLIQEVTVIETFPNLRENLEAASFAFWGGELVDHLVEEGAGGTLYSEFLTYLARVNAGAEPLDVRAFELAVLVDLGWRPELTSCAYCHGELTQENLSWSHRLGGVIDATCAATQVIDRSVSVAAVKTLRLLTDHHWQVSQRISAPQAVINEVEDILHHYLESIGERQFRSLLLLPAREEDQT